MMTERDDSGSRADVRSGADAADGGLLRRYVREHDDAAFRALVERHLDLVYSTACRRLAGDSHSAADVAQQVFTALARQAGRLSEDVVLPAWLYVTTRHLSANWVRAEQSRRAREEAAQRLHLMNAAPETDWEQVRPMLEAVLDELGERDRDAILLRFFSRRTFAEIGVVLRVSEDAARMRVERALEKLRNGLARRGVASTAVALGGALAQHAVVSAPAGLAATVVSAALQAAGAVGAGLVAFMTWTKLSLGVAAAAVVVGVATVAMRDETKPVVEAVAERSAAVEASPQVSAETTPRAAGVTLERRAASVGATVAAKTEGPVYPPISLSDVLGPNNLFYDGVTGVSMTYAPGWGVYRARRWGDRNRENTVTFVPPSGAGIGANMYYNMYAYGAPPPVTSEEFLRTSAQKKEQQRVAGGLKDYKNVPESFVFRELDGRPALSYFATYTHQDRVMAEYFMRIVGQKGYVMFFVSGPAENVQAQIPTIYKMGTTVRVP